MPLGLGVALRSDSDVCGWAPAQLGDMKFTCLRVRKDCRDLTRKATASGRSLHLGAPARILLVPAVVMVLECCGTYLQLQLIVQNFPTAWPSPPTVESVHASPFTMVEWQARVDKAWEMIRGRWRRRKKDESMVPSLDTLWEDLERMLVESVPVAGTAAPPAGSPSAAVSST